MIDKGVFCRRLCEEGVGDADAEEYETCTLGTYDD